MFRFYIEVARTAFRRQLIYRWANLAGLLTNIFFGSIFSYVIVALYHVRPNVSGFSLLDALRYTWLIQAMVMVVLPFSWYDLLLNIRSGEVISDVSKPCDFYWYWFSRETGRSVYYLLFRCLPTYTVGALLFGFGFPSVWQDWLLYALVLLLGMMIGIAIRFLYNVVAFWTGEARAIAFLSGTLALFFTGSYIPLPFMPAWLRVLAEWLPFNGLMSLPAQVLMGKVTGSAIWFEVARQGGWLIALTLCARLVTMYAMKRVSSQGG